MDQTIALPLGGGPHPFSIRSLIPFLEPISFVTFVTLLSGSSRNSLTTSLSAGRPRFLFVVSRSLLAIFPSMYVTYLCHRLFMRIGYLCQLVTPEIKKIFNNEALVLFLYSLLFRRKSSGLAVNFHCRSNQVQSYHTVQKNPLKIFMNACNFSLSPPP